jgi:hypothetical protein
MVHHVIRRHLLTILAPFKSFGCSDEAIRLALLQRRWVKEKPGFHFIQCWLSRREFEKGETNFH